MLSFCVASIACIMAPGPDNIMVLSTGISKGKRPAIAFAFGCGLGCISHALWAALGVTALIAASETAFQAVKFLGAAYLIYLGYLSFKSGAIKINSEADTQTSKINSWHYLGRGFLANALNPKVAIFFMAFLPQFVEVGTKSMSQEMFFLGALNGVFSIILFSILGFFSGSIGQWLGQKPDTMKWLDKLAGSVFILLAIKLVTVTIK